MVVRTLGFVLVRRLVGLAGLGPAPDERDAEIAVLRHQLMVLRRQVRRPRFTPSDRMVLAVLARLLPRDRWPVFLVTPGTLLRWHRELVARRWTYPHTGQRRRGVDPAVVEVVLRLARENPRWGYARIVHNDRLVDALRCQAFSALRGSPGARAYYNALRARGTGHNAALRQLANRLVGILHGCLKTRTCYDETKAWAHHTNEDQQTAA